MTQKKRRRGEASGSVPQRNTRRGRGGRRGPALSPADVGRRKLGLITLDYVLKKGSKKTDQRKKAMRSIMWKQLRARARARAIAMLRARVNITTGRKGTRFVTSTSEADRE